MNRAYIYIAIACAVVVTIIAAYGTYRCNHPDFKDPLTYSLIEGEPWNRFLDGWSISHYLFYAILAYYFPSYWFYLFLLGAVWEGVEAIFYDHPFYLSDCKYIIDTDANQRGSGRFWYGKWEDLIMNTLGIITGVIIARKNN